MNPPQPPRQPPRYIPTLTEVVAPSSQVAYSAQSGHPAHPERAPQPALTSLPPGMAPAVPPRPEADVLDLDLQEPADFSPPPVPPSFLRAPNLAEDPAAPPDHRDAQWLRSSPMFGVWNPPVAGAEAPPQKPPLHAQNPVQETATPVDPADLLRQASEAFTRELQQQMTLWLTHWCQRNADAWARQWAEAAAPMMREAMKAALQEALKAGSGTGASGTSGGGAAHK